MHKNTHDITGKRIGRWIVISYAGKSRWNCRCDCGTLGKPDAWRLASRTSLSCGCLHHEMVAARNRTHGQPKDKTYHTWSQIIQRCDNKNNPSYHLYGGRGITVCKRWRRYDNFLADMGRPASSDLTIDRINNNGHYRPSNCRWATHKQQNRNRRDNVSVSFGGKTMLICEWADELGVSCDTLYQRRYHGWPVERMLTEPVRKR